MKVGDVVVVKNWKGYNNHNGKYGIIVDGPNWQQQYEIRFSNSIGYFHKFYLEVINEV